MEHGNYWLCFFPLEFSLRQRLTQLPPKTREIRTNPGLYATLMESLISLAGHPLMSDTGWAGRNVRIGQSM